jgi:hypothetical protein
MTVCLQAFNVTKLKQALPAPRPHGPKLPLLFVQTNGIGGKGEFPGSITDSEKFIAHNDLLMINDHGVVGGMKQFNIFGVLRNRMNLRRWGYF